MKYDNKIKKIRKQIEDLEKEERNVTRKQFLHRSKNMKSFEKNALWWSRDYEKWRDYGVLMEK